PITDHRNGPRWSLNIERQETNALTHFHMRFTTLLKKANSLALVVGSMLPAAAIAQVSLYTFSSTVEAYTEITDADGGFSLGTPTVNPPLHNLRAWANPNDLEGTVTNSGYLQPAIGPGFPTSLTMVMSSIVSVSRTVDGSVSENPAMVMRRS
ncbi:MAG TPA: hypothetical protein PL070_12495, partial [Flavobacteriales bacterium]|nr:hypothetical protein [Flavobacteriales bacterium]